MKKLISIVLVFLMLMLNIPHVFAAESLSVSFYTEEGAKNTEKRVFLQSDADTDALDLFIAAYKENTLVASEKIDIKLYEGIAAYDTGVNWDEVEKDKVKIFVWDENCHPYANYEYEVLRPVSSKLSVFTVTEDATEVDDNGKTTYRIRGTYKGKDTIIFVYNPKGYPDKNPKDFKVGDLALVSEPDGNGIVSYIEELDAEEVHGVVCETPIIDIAKYGYDPEAENWCRIGDRDFMTGTFDMDKYLGKAVTAYVYEETIVSVEEESGKNSSVVISSGQLVESDSRFYDYAGTIAYYEKNAVRATELLFDNDVEFFINYGNNSLNGINTTTADIASCIPFGGRIECISNDGEDRIEYVLITSYDDEAVIRNVNVKNGVYSFSTYTGYLEDINTLDEDEYTQIYLDGIKTDVSKMAKGHTVNGVEIARDCRILYASTGKVKGEVDSYDSSEETVSINENTYSISPCYGVSVSKLFGSEGTFYLNVDGEISYKRTEKIYDLVLAVWQDTASINNGYFAQVLHSDGTIGEYEIASNAKYYDNTGNIIYSQTGASDNKNVADILAGTLSGSNTECKDVVKVTAQTADNALFELEIVNEQIRKVKELDGAVTVDFETSNTEKYDSLSMSYGSVEFDEDTIVYALGNSSESDIITEKDIAVGKIGDYFKDGENYKFTALDVAGGLSPVIISYGFTLPEIPEEEPEISEEKHSLVLGVWQESTGLIRGYFAQVAHSDGTIKEYQIASNAKYYDNTGSMIPSMGTEDEKHIADTLASTLSGTLTECTNAVKVTAQTASSSIFNITIADGKIAKVKELTGTTLTTYESTNALEYDAEKMTYGTAVFDENTIIYALGSSLGSDCITDKDLFVEKVSDCLENGKNYKFTALDIAEGISPVIIGYDFVIPEEEPEILEEKYSLVLGVWQDYTGLTGGYFAQVAHSDGTVSEYEIAANAKYYDNTGSMIPSMGTEDEKHIADTLASALSGTLTECTDAVKVTVQTASSAIFNITITDGKITKVKELEGNVINSYSEENLRVYDADAMAYGNATFNENTVVYNIDSKVKTDTVTSSKLSAGKIGDYFTDGENYMFTALDVDEKDISHVVIGYKLIPDFYDDSYMVVVTGKKIVEHNKEDAFEISGIQNGEEVSYTIYNENGYYTTDPSSIMTGDVIMVGVADKFGVAKDVERLFKKGEGLDTSSDAYKGNKDKEIAVAYGTLDKANTTDSKFYIDSNVANFESDGITVATLFYHKNDGIPMKSSANYTLVDYTENAHHPTVSKKSPGLSLFSTSSMYTSYVLVRVYEGVIYDVVVMRYEA